MATNNAVNSPLSGTTGTGNFVGATSPTITTPNIVGTSTNNNASAGSVGELISSAIASGSAISMGTTGTITNVTSISLTAGDWDVFGNIVYGITTQSAITSYYGWVSSASATQPDLSLAAFIPVISAAFSGGVGFVVPTLRFSLASTTTIYLTGEWSGTAVTVTGYGGIYARRRR